MEKTNFTPENKIEITNRGAVGIYRSKRQIFFANMLGGIGWGIGTILGATVFVAILLSSLNVLGGLPLIGNIFYDLAVQIGQGMR